VPSAERTRVMMKADVVRSISLAVGEFEMLEISPARGRVVLDGEARIASRFEIYVGAVVGVEPEADVR
jgi:hypothetical protein